MPFEEVKAFYEGKSAAWPIGYFWVNVLPPVETPVTEDYDKRLQLWLDLPLKRYRDDPTSETLIIAEVSKEPSDIGPLGIGPMLFCYLPFTVLAGLGIALRRYDLRLKRAEQSIS